MNWLTAAEALERLGTKPQTLYANVSRGRIRARPDPRDSRKSLYNGDDVDRLAGRPSGRRKAETVAAEAIHWGDPVLPTTISTISNGRLLYRGRDAAELSRKAGLEEVAALLWQAGKITLRAPEAPATEKTPWGRAMVTMARRAAGDPPSFGRSAEVLAREAASVLASLAAAFMGPENGEKTLHERLAANWQRPDAADALRRALVLLADHELNASAFAVRVTVSTGASLAAGVLSGLATLSGPLHGGAAAALPPLIAVVERDGAAAAVRDWLGQGRPIPAFGHKLYPDGDVRAPALLAGFTLPPAYAELATEVEAVVGERPNVDFALAALAAAHDLPAEAPLAIFALGRAVGWLAHGLEQAATGTLIRPRAHYVGDGGNAG
jgi:citrate synthase